MHGNDWNMSHGVLAWNAMFLHLVGYFPCDQGVSEKQMHSSHVQ